MRRPETHKYNYTKPTSIAENEKRINELAVYDYRNPKGCLELAIVDKSSNEYIGYSGFTNGESIPPWSSTEIYYTLYPSYFNQGYGTETVAAMLGFGFDVLKFHRILAGAAAENIASWKIMEKLGMRREAHWKKDRPIFGTWDPDKGFENTGKWADGFGYAINDDEYMALKE